ncbi:hypothetical protein EBI01_08125 [Marinomonas rhizomae]|uniref:CorA-like Mg2+ transporter protein n=1 Tax=Marinomonas rhizomae TaxID=491948 RepID=A0A366J9J2_9GAMM|nr:hypothetical protein [Marinomonas rhizomae]RBP82538.1 hypothetical protein DFP80_108185 [Marinomonas rhizomae]RNF73677.1 hypothetical protein EBI01_08125 [Marinomonas rhizomae]
MLDFKIYAPINVPINWQSELITDSEQRYKLLKKFFSSIPLIDIKPNNWLMGYGSLEHDYLPDLYQPAAVITLNELSKEDDIKHADLYVYDNCLAILYVGLTVDSDIAHIDDLAISQRIELLSQQYISPILEQFYTIKTTYPLIEPSKYKFFNNDHAELTNAKPLWVARMLTQNKSLSSEHYTNWIKNIDVQTDLLQLGSGNSLLRKEECFSDVHRIMVMSQFHAALMYRIEELLKGNLKKFNSNHYNESSSTPLSSYLAAQQYRNDHIEYINIQVSAASSGVQGRRRELLQQFHKAWGGEEQRERIAQLVNLTQMRIDRLFQDKLRQQNRSMQTLLGFLGSLGLISLVIDLINIEREVTHNDTMGLLDLVHMISSENFLSSTVIIVVFFTLYFYKSHE